MNRMLHLIRLLTIKVMGWVEKFIEYCINELKSAGLFGTKHLEVIGLINTTLIIK
jgi:hypothetical protein